MAKRKNDLATLAAHLSRPVSKAPGAGVSASSRMPSIGRDDTRRSITNPTVSAKTVSFGHPSRVTAGTQANGGSELRKFLQNAATSGLSGALSGSFNVGVFGGLGSLVTGITSLLGGGNKSTPPLVEFQLPNSINTTLAISRPQRQQSSGLTAVATGVSASAEANSGVPNTRWIQANSQGIAQAVKTALLQSSSLSDVINEL